MEFCIEFHLKIFQLLLISIEKSILPSINSHAIKIQIYNN